MIIQQQDQLKSVQETVQTTVHDSAKTGMKTYASTVSKSCTSAFVPEKLQFVVRKVAVAEERLKTSELEEKPVIRDCLRVAARMGNSVWPIKFPVGSTDHAPMLRTVRSTCAQIEH